MAAPKNNSFWKLRSKHGRDKIFSKPEILLTEANKYFTYCDENPLKEQKVFHAQGIITKTDVDKMRAYTWEGLELFLGISSLRKYKTQPEYKDFVQVIKEIEQIIYTQKFSGAAADLLNPNIIARDLGLSDKRETNLNIKEKTIADLLKPTENSTLS